MKYEQQEQQQQKVERAEIVQREKSGLGGDYIDEFIVIMFSLGRRPAWPGARNQRGFLIREIYLEPTAAHEHGRRDENIYVYNYNFVVLPTLCTLQIGERIWREDSRGIGWEEEGELLIKNYIIILSLCVCVCVEGSSRLIHVPSVALLQFDTKQKKERLVEHLYNKPCAHKNRACWLY